MNDQPNPTRNESTPVWDLVIKDMQERDQVGRQRYGTPLQAHNGRDSLIDAYQEALDLVVYLRQRIAEGEDHYERCLRELHSKLGIFSSDVVGVPDKRTRDLRVALVEEEFNEYKAASEAGDIVEVADGLADLMVVVVGAAVAWGIPIRACFDEVHRSNMTKVLPDGTVLRREDGKVIKPPNYSPADLARVLRESGWEADQERDDAE